MGPPGPTRKHPATLHVERIGERTYRLAGELDPSTVDRLELAVSREMGKPGPLEFDLSGLSFMDSRGLTVLIRIARRAGGDVILRSPQPAVERALWLTGIGSESRWGLRTIPADPLPDASRGDRGGSDFFRPE